MLEEAFNEFLGPWLTPEGVLGALIIFVFVAVLLYRN